MAFIETRFPVDISYGSAGGPGYSTSIVEIKSGREKRNVNWSYPRHEYDAAVGIRKLTDLYDLINFFHVAHGMGHGFRYKDWADYKSCSIGNTAAFTDQEIGTGDASETEFQLIKTYFVGSDYLIRQIFKPVSGSVVVGIDGVNQASGWTVDTTTGIVTFSSAPGSGLSVTAGFEFDVPCRFDTDKLSNRIDMYEAGSTAVPIIELKLESEVA